MRYLPYILGGLIGLATFGCGLWVGRKITLDAINDTVSREKAQLLLDQAEVRRMSIGRTAGMIDGEGHTIKLYTPSALRRLSDDQLRGLCASRGIMIDKVFSGRTNRGEMITAVEQHQRSVMPAWVNLEDRTV